MVSWTYLLKTNEIIEKMVVKNEECGTKKKIEINKNIKYNQPDVELKLR